METLYYPISIILSFLFRNEIKKRKDLYYEKDLLGKKESRH